ncbi:hypothetical protein PR048_011602 [Dryococelus australis]|uniref:Uncharacterized protein n=1 Tax=Dryococelus australis TaxID=614101 RepID=A0ABQ9HM03_9NEOP|nr:hypothetical protein PR048_011602 [Dryococelus australis]
MDTVEEGKNIDVAFRLWSLETYLGLPASQRINWMVNTSFASEKPRNIMKKINKPSICCLVLSVVSGLSCRACRDYVTPASVGEQSDEKCGHHIDARKFPEEGTYPTDNATIRAAAAAGKTAATSLCKIRHSGRYTGHCGTRHGISRLVRPDLLPDLVIGHVLVFVGCSISGFVPGQSHRSFRAQGRSPLQEHINKCGSGANATNRTNSSEREKACKIEKRVSLGENLWNNRSGKMVYWLPKWRSKMVIYLLPIWRRTGFQHGIRMTVLKEREVRESKMLAGFPRATESEPEVLCPRLPINLLLARCTSSRSKIALLYGIWHRSYETSAMTSRARLVVLVISPLAPPYHSRTFQRPMEQRRNTRTGEMEELRRTSSTYDGARRVSSIHDTVVASSAFELGSPWRQTPVLGFIKTSTTRKKKTCTCYPTAKAARLAKEFHAKAIRVQIPTMPQLFLGCWKHDGRCHMATGSFEELFLAKKRGSVNCDTATLIKRVIAAKRKTCESACS